MKRRIVHLVWRDGYWCVRDSGKDVITSINKINALKMARSHARACEPSQLVVHGKNGRIQAEYTYGNDPRRYVS